MKRSIFALLLVAAVAATAFAQVGRAGLLRLRISGYVGPRPEGVAPVARWVVDAQGKQLDFTADRIDVLVGNASPGDVTQALDPYVPAFRLAGIDSAVRAFAETPPNQRIVMIGALRLGAGARTLMIDRVDPLPAPTPVE
jgi:hypothetical protein